MPSERRPRKKRTTPQDGAETRRRIEEVALELFASHGFRGISVKDLMLACDLTPGALYNHFPSKDDLLYSLILKFADELDDLIEQSMADASDDPADQLFRLLKAIAQFAIRSPKATKISNIDYVELPEPLRRTVVKSRQELRRWIERLISEGIANRAFTVPTFDGKNDIKLVATAMANVAVRLSESYGPVLKGDAEKLSDYHAELALRMIRTRA